MPPSGKNICVARFSIAMPADTALERLHTMIGELEKLGCVVQTATRLDGWLCGLCGLISFNRNDAVNDWCGCCGNDALPQICAHRQDRTN
jgi:hypothetical protein